MAEIAVLGAGGVARALAGGWSAAGHAVVVGARNPARWEVEGVPATGLAQAAARGDVVVNALPGDVAVQVLGGLADALAGKVVVDVANAVVPDAQGFAAALLYPDTSLAEEIQRVLPESRVVKTLNTAHVSVMADPGSLTAAPDAFVCGDDEAARKTVSALLHDLGWPADRVLDLGVLTAARPLEAFMLLVGGLVRGLGPVPFALSVAR